MPAEILLTPAELAVVDAAAPACGVPLERLIEAAGRAIANLVRARFAPCRTLVVCGPGHNGGDGAVAAQRLHEAGWPVSVATLAAPPAALARFAGPRVAASAVESGRADLIIDAGFGAGLSRDLPQAAAAVLSAAAGPIVAVDVPSGLDGTTGQPRGTVSQAALTLTFVCRKPGHVLLPGRRLCGAVVLAEIGMPPAALAAAGPPKLFANTPALWSLPRLEIEGHKYTRGHVVVLGGRAMSGAARLAAAAARSVGAGLVTVAAEDGAGDLFRATLPPGVIVSDAPLATLLADARLGPYVCGPGLQPDRAAAALAEIVAAGRPVVGDAGVFGTADLRGATVLTPHAGEFARAFGPVGTDKVQAARAAAARTGAVLLLKGADTVIAAPDGRVAINENAPPELATAGAGDVLAGMIGGLLAQQQPQQGQSPWEAACAAAWLHGAAAQLVGAGLLAEQVPPALPAAIEAARRAVMPPTDR